MCEITNHGDIVNDAQYRQFDEDQVTPSLKIAQWKPVPINTRYLRANIQGKKHGNKTHEAG